MGNKKTLWELYFYVVRLVVMWNKTENWLELDDKIMGN